MGGTGKSGTGMSGTRIVVIDGYTINPGDNPWDELERLGETTIYDRTPPDAPEAIVERCRDAEVVLTNKVPIRKETIERLPGLRYIGVTATGYDIIDLEAARARDIVVTNVPVYGTRSVAQYVFALLLELCHHVGLHDHAVKDGEWTRCPDFSFWKRPTLELDGKTMSVIGFGRIGRLVGALAHAFGMQVLAYDVRRGDAPAYEPFAWAPSVRDAFARADAVSLNCAMNADNREMVDAALISTMKPDALLVNAARGGLVNERDLADALNAGRIAGAAVDVVSSEPIRPDNPLLRAKNCIITPHIAWASLESRRRLRDESVENVRSYLEGRERNRL